MSMREKLREVVKDAAWNYHDEEWRDGTADIFIDAVLDALMEPTEGMIEAGNEKMNWGPNGLSEIWPLMIQAAKDGK